MHHRYAEHEAVDLDVAHAGVAHALGDVADGLEVVHGARQVAVGLAVAGDQAAHERREGVEVEVEQLLEAEHARAVELQEDGAAAGLA